MAIDYIITSAGLAELVNAQADGFPAIKITQIALGAATWTPDETATSLQSEIKRLTVTAGGAAGAAQIHVNALDSSSDAYDAHEIGLYLETGTLLAIASSADVLVAKASTTRVGVAANIELTGSLTVDMVAFGDTNFLWNSATTASEGIARLATGAEVLSGTGADTIVTPGALQARTGTETRTGLLAIATEAEVASGTEAGKAVSPLRLSEAVTPIMLSADALAGRVSDLEARTNEIEAREHQFVVWSTAADYVLSGSMYNTTLVLTSGGQFRIDVSALPTGGRLEIVNATQLEGFSNQRTIDGADGVEAGTNYIRRAGQVVVVRNAGGVLYMTGGAYTASP